MAALLSRATTCRSPVPGPARVATPCSCRLLQCHPSAVNPARMRARRRRGEVSGVVTRASGRGDGGDKDGGERDWDAKWREFVKTFQFDPEDFVDRPATPPGWGGAAKEDIRRSERQVLAAWTSPTFAKAGILVVVATLFVFVVVVGPPPSDGRCTLPFCG